MAIPPVIRKSRSQDRDAIVDLYPRAFPEEDLLALVRLLIADRGDVISLVAESAGTLVGHAAFTLCTIDGDPAQAALLGPLAVAPEVQRTGIGGALVRAGCKRLSDRGIARVFVLGDPGYYGRFGFATDDEVPPPHPNPGEWRPAWQSLALVRDAGEVAGTLVVPAPWQDPALWQP